ncbi:AHH domain-containing protein, partial [Tenacibaculum sp. TC6]|uniref:AHH domain-containing protein n=1 Tax=Tenacibaculum sp. TC6 TaxID=3423223 RepID=UPI003D360913
VPTVLDINLNDILTPEQLLFLSQYPSLESEIKGFLRANNNSEEAKKWAKGQAELGADAQNIPWTKGTGIVANNPNLKYTHYRHNYGKNISYFKLEGGGEIAVSGVEKKLTTSGGLVDKYKDTAGVDFGGKFYYIKVDDNGLWSEMLFDPKNLGDQLKTLFALGGVELGKLLGRYVIPIEDIKVLIEGKDFDGQEVSRWQAAGFLLLTVVPGSKALKVVKGLKVVSKTATRWAIAAITADGKATKLVFDVINGVVEFGSRSDLVKMIGTKVGEEAHHIIPWAQKTLDVVQEAARAGFHMNAKINGIALQKYSKLIGEGLHGNHPAYNTFVERAIQNFTKSKPNFNPEQAKEFLEKELIPDLLGYIERAKNSGLNLNEFFKTLL